MTKPITFKPDVSILDNQNAEIETPSANTGIEDKTLNQELHQIFTKYLIKETNKAPDPVVVNPTVVKSELREKTPKTPRKSKQERKKSTK